MMLAETGPNERIVAKPGLAGACPICHMEVIPKCGEIKVWHWAHKSLKECDHWSEPESEWHFGWKKLAGLENSEIVIRRPEGTHRADIKIDNRVIELQHSNLSPKDVREREAFYGNMIWVIDGDELLKNVTVERMISREDGFYFVCSFKKKSWMDEIKKPIYYHFKSLAVYTYYYQKRYTIHNFSHQFGERSGWKLDYEKPVGKWHRVAIDGYPMIYEDVILQPGKEKYCYLKSKDQFKKELLTPRNPSTKKQDSLFDF